MLRAIKYELNPTYAQKDFAIISDGKVFYLKPKILKVKSQKIESTAKNRQQKIPKK